MLVQKAATLDTLLKYQQYLGKQYAAELTELYIPVFEKAGDNSSSRSDYAGLKRKMQAVIKDMPAAKGKIIAIASRLIQKYPRRPAMIDELMKVVK